MSSVIGNVQQEHVNTFFIRVSFNRKMSAYKIIYINILLIRVVIGLKQTFSCTKSSAFTFISLNLILIIYFLIHSFVLHEFHNFIYFVIVLV